MGNHGGFCWDYEAWRDDRETKPAPKTFDDLTEQDLEVMLLIVRSGKSVKDARNIVLEMINR